VAKGALAVTSFNPANNSVFIFLRETCQTSLLRTQHLLGRLRL